jgi:hypothetical protein
MTELIIKGREELTILPHAHRQIGQHWKVRADFYDRLRTGHPALFDHLISGLMREASVPRMVRTYTGEGGAPGVARAMMSNGYRRVDYDQIAEVVLPILGEIPDVRIESCCITDEKMYIKALAPQTQVDLGDLGGPKVGDIVSAGVVIKNSEVGSGTMAVEQMLYRLICTNGMIVPEGLKVRHAGRRVPVMEDFSIYRDDTLRADDKALMLKTRDAVRAAVDGVRFSQLAAQFAQTGSTQPMENPVEGIKVLAKVISLTDGESDSVLKHLATGGDLTQFGAINAVTRTAEDIESYDRATEMEGLGFKVMAMSSSEWAKVATAVA